MLAHWGAQLAVMLLRRGTLSVEDSDVCMTVLLERMGALPLRDVIYTESDRNSPDFGKLIVRGREIDLEQMRRLRGSAQLALENQALTLIREQVAYEAMVYGVHKAETPAQMFFARAALWWGAQEQKKLETLAQRDPSPPDTEE